MNESENQLMQFMEAHITAAEAAAESVSADDSLGRPIAGAVGNGLAAVAWAICYAAELVAHSIKEGR